MTFGKRVRDCRKARGFNTQEDLAERIGVSRNAVSAWERDESVPDGNNLSKLSEVLDVPVEELIKGDRRFGVQEPPPISEESLEDAKTLLKKAEMVAAKGGLSELDVLRWVADLKLRGVFKDGSN